RIRLSTLTPVIPIADTNTNYTPVSGTPYHEEFLLPATPQAAGIGVNAKNFLSGIYQVNCVYPTAQGRLNATTRAALVRTHFKRGTQLTTGQTVLTVQGVGINPPFMRDGWWVVPVSIRYTADTPN